MDFDFTPMSNHQREALAMFIALNPKANKDLIVSKMVKKFKMTPNVAWIITCRYFNEQHTIANA